MAKRQDGFAHFGLILLVVLVAGALGAIGWKVLHKDSTTPSSAATNTQTIDTNKNSNIASDNKETRSSDELIIKEWGVKIPLSAKDLGAYYTLTEDVQQSPSDPSGLTVYAKEADELTGPTGKSCKGEYVAFLIRLPADDPRWQPATSVDDGNVSPLYGERIVLGAYRYAIATKKEYGPQCLATSNTGDYQLDQRTAKKFADVVDAFTSDFKKIRAN